MELNVGGIRRLKPPKERHFFFFYYSFRKSLRRRYLDAKALQHIKKSRNAAYNSELTGCKEVRMQLQMSVCRFAVHD